ncbi:MAG TPA: carboxymuconolactone decarboxylase family protein [Methylomirabilota bacterium]|nr:carboxymuconolactone decarboxylase family protein [Methylomirabilota bacterium]
MDALEQLRAAIPDAAKDIRLNLQAVLRGGSLSEPQRWGVAAAAAVAARHPRLREAVLAAASTAAGAAVVEDARAAASLMAMNNVYYRFRHMVGKPIYREKPAGLRMNRLMQPATNRVDFELMSLAVSAINGCETCVRAHEKTVTDGGLTADQVNDAVRIAATIYAAAVALEAGETAATEAPLMPV